MGSGPVGLTASGGEHSRASSEVESRAGRTGSQIEIMMGHG